MKNLVKNSLESVLSDNCIIRTTDGRNHVVIHAESGASTLNILSELNKQGVNFFFENYLDKRLEFDEITGKEKKGKAKKEKFSKFVIRIEELKEKCPDLYLELKEHNKMSQMVWQYQVDNNLIDDYFFV